MLTNRFRGNFSVDDSTIELTISKLMQIEQGVRALDALHELLSLGKPVDQDHIDLLDAALFRINKGLEN